MKKFNCFIIGNQTRLIECAQILIEKKHKIEGIITKDSEVKIWAKKKGINVFSCNDDVREILKKKEFDYLFSIDNFQLLSNEILRAPRKLTINFHDGPLPAYAGSNVTAWAIINGEDKHGVTWHIATERADAGDILKQEIFPLSNNETTFSSNAKCLEISLKLFGELIDELSEGKLEPVKQDLSKRSFFPLWKRPNAGGTFDFTKSAEELFNLWRGLNYGNYFNPLCLPKIYLGDRVFLFERAKIIDEIPHNIACSIIGFDENYLSIMTSTRVIKVENLYDLDGEKIKISDLFKKYNLKIGDLMPRLSEDQINGINSQYKEIARFEDYWLNRIKNITPLIIPYMNFIFKNTISEQRIFNEKINIDIKELVNRATNEIPGDLLEIALILYLWKLSDLDSFDIEYRDKKKNKFIEDIKGYFAKGIPIRLEIDPNEVFCEAYRSIKSQIREHLNNMTFASDLIFRSPDLRSNVIRDKKLRNLITINRVNKLLNDNPDLPSKLMFTITDDGKEIILSCYGETISIENINAMENQINNFIKEIINKPNAKIKELSILPEKERKKIIEIWNDTKVDYPHNVCLHHIFEKQVQEVPERTALIFDSEKMSYKELNEKANKLANFLIKEGTKKEDLIALFMDRSFEMVISLLGILKTGAAYVPIDPDYPKERAIYILKDTGAKFLLTTNGMKEKVTDFNSNIIYLDNYWQKISLESKENPKIDINEENIAYVIYTSGSTGRPKGVMNTHKGICNRIFWMQDAFNLTERDRVLQKTPYTFDVSVWEFFWPLSVGSTMVISEPGGHRDTSYLIKVIINEEITTIHFVPSMLKLFLEDKDVKKCKCLKRVICSGEVLSYELQEKFFSILGAELHNLYGPTEAAVDVTHWPCKKGDSRHIVPIGRPISNTKIYILDRWMQPVPIGIPGELYIGGVQVARGYLNMPELSSEKFVPDPFSEGEKARLYKTGDICRYLSDGNIEYLGRKDFQIKIRGLRIEIEEIERVLCEHQKIKAAAVIVGEDDVEKYIAAYIVFKDEMEGKIEDIRNYLKNKIPDYMIPKFIIPIKEIPLTSSGKLDRKSLPAIDRKIERDISVIPPKGRTEEIIYQVWVDFLKVDKIGRNENFFDLGGTSLLLIRVRNKLQEIFKREISIVEMFLHPSIEELAKLIEEREKDVSFSTIKTRAEKQKQFFKEQKRK